MEAYVISYVAAINAREHREEWQLALALLSRMDACVEAYVISYVPASVADVLSTIPGAGVETNAIR